LIRISYPCNYTHEKEYILDIIFAEFLGLDFESTPDAVDSIISIYLDNGNILELNDCFFSNAYRLNKSYLEESFIPSEIVHLDLKNAPENNIIGLYGKPIVSIKSNKIYCGIDIFASSFYMLTRWEEYVIKKRDNHGRFPVQSSLAYKHGFLSRPIVNEYVEVIWHWLTILGITQARKLRQFEFINTHDIDRICLFETKLDIIVKPVKALLVEKSLASFVYHLKLAIKSLKGKDSYLSFEYLMDSSEKCGVKSHFFFMGALKKTKYNNGYNISDRFVKDIIKRIIKRGHTIGIHPSYDTLNNQKLFRTELDSIRDVSDTEVICGRQHYLRFELPATWQNWENNKLQWDSSLAYSEQEGFRCGVCYSFSVYNILSRVKLKLREKPLTIMDATLCVQRKMSPRVADRVISYYIFKVKKYSGEFVFLWHNSSFDYMGWRNYKEVYDRALSNISSL
jgi:peptidoglycan/xylan/chitin deacetylase (PgdA/CDA1 family)